ncbi:MAG TPA: DUF4157 domain-containing protein [Ktedonobacteraceae bacterium]|nr:DUF4157 domain-containing protein [Ktedonobacteraceae bacterium]
MSTFNHLQRKSITPIPAVPTSRQLKPPRSHTQESTPASEHVSPDRQTQQIQAARLQYSLDRISIFPPEKKNDTGLPDSLKRSVETLSGFSMDDVKVHYNSSQPIKVHALAYAQGSDIHVGPHQEKQLAHEAWHVVQQKQGRVKPTLQAKDVAINDDQKLEREADVMGAKASQQENGGNAPQKIVMGLVNSGLKQPLQRKLIYSQEAIDEDKETLTVAGATKVTSAALINAAEPLQIPELAQALGQKPVAYERGKPTPLAGEPLHYLIGHITNTLGTENEVIESDWAGHQPDQVAEDFARGGIESPSTVTLIACMAGQHWGPQLARALKDNHKDVSVISSTGMVHATGAGIASYAPKADIQEAQEQGFTGTVDSKTIETVKKVRKQLGRHIDDYRREMRKLQPQEAEKLLEQAKAEIATFFNEAIRLLNRSQAKFSSFAKTANEGWMVSRGTTTRPITDEESMIGVPLPSGKTKVYHRIEAPELAAVYQALPLAKLLDPFYLLTPSNIVAHYGPSPQEQRPQTLPSSSEEKPQSAEIVQIFGITETYRTF